MLAYIWNTQGKLPSEIYNLPDSEKEFVYQATMLKIREEQRAEKARRKGK